MCMIKKIFMVLMMVCIGCIVGCAKKEEQPESLYGLLVDYEIIVEIKKDSLTPTGFELTLKNKGMNCQYEFGYDGRYMIEKYKDGKWSEVERNYSSEESIEISYNLSSEKSVDFKDSWSDRYGELPEGKYRYIKMLEKKQEGERTQEVCFFIEFSL